MKASSLLHTAHVSHNHIFNSHVLILLLYFYSAIYWSLTWSLIIEPALGTSGLTRAPGPWLSRKHAMSGVRSWPWVVSGHGHQAKTLKEYLLWLEVHNADEFMSFLKEFCREPIGCMQAVFFGWYESEFLEFSKDFLNALILLLAPEQRPHYSFFWITSINLRMTQNLINQNLKSEVPEAWCPRQD